MKKLIVIAVALLFMIPAFAIAEDKLSIGGTYYFWAYDTDNYANFDDDNNADDNADFYSKLRVGVTVKPADDITVYWRMDIEEGSWGLLNAGPWARGPVVHYDYAWAKITKEMGSFTAGYQAFAYGNNINFYMGPGFNLTITPPDTPISISLRYSKNSEGGDIDDAFGNEDHDIYGLNFKFKTDAVALSAFAVARSNKINNSLVTLLGASVSTKLGPVALAAEMNVFGGSQDAAYGGADYKGLNLFVQATLNPTEAFMVAFQGLYAKGYDGVNEVQIHQIAFDADLGTFSPFDYGMQQGENLLCTSGLEYLGANAGVVGLNIIADFRVNDFTLIQGSIGYIQPEEDNMSVFDDAMIFNIGVTFNVATGTRFGVQYNMVNPDGDTGLVNDDAAQAFMAGLYINF